VFDESMFYRKRKTEFLSYCKDCNRIRVREWKLSHPEAMRKINRRDQARHPERVKLQAKKDREKRKGLIPDNLPKRKICPKCKIERDISGFMIYEGYLRTPCRRCRGDLTKLWAIENNDKVIASNHRRAERSKNLPGNFTEEEWSGLKSKYNHTCMSCGRREPEIKLTVDHIIPITRPGSSNFIDNIQPLCKSCNCSKGNRIVDFRPLSMLTEVCYDNEGEI
jgi:5-methylcytosine-specific restriction endonuclease McrA